MEEKQKAIPRASLLKKIDKIAIACSLLFFVFWAFILLYKYLHFGYYDWDLAFFSQAMWNLTHGSPYVSLFGINFFANHANLFSYLITPIFAIAPHPLTLVFLKVISYTSGAFVLYLIAKKKLDWIGSIIIMLLYLIYPPNVFGMIYEFDFESLAPIFLFLLIYFFKEKRFLPFLITSLLLISLKENMALIVGTFGLYGMVAAHKKRIMWGVVPFLLGVLSFYFLTSIFIPSFSTHKEYAYLTMYQHLGRTPAAILKTLINPFAIKSLLLQPDNLMLIQELFSPVLGLSFFSPHILFLISPIILQHLLSKQMTEHAICYQYGVSIAPFIFLALIPFFHYVYSKYRRGFYYTIIVSIFCLSICCTLSYMPSIIQRVYPHNDRLDANRWQMVKQIPATATVIASFDFLAELSMRKSLYAFHSVYDNPNYILPQNIDNALIDFRDPWLCANYSRDPKRVSSLIYKFFSERSDLRVDRAVNNIILFKRKAREGYQLLEVSKPSHQNLSETPPLAVDDKFSLISYEITRSITQPGILMLTFNWYATKDIADNYADFFVFRGAKKVILWQPRTIAYSIYPTPLWEKGNLIKERYWLNVPEMDMGNFSLEIGFVNTSTKQATHLTSSISQSISQENLFKLGDIADSIKGGRR